MRTRHFAPVVSIALAISAQASPTILYEYSTQTIQPHVVVRDINGIVELSSMEAGCSPTMVGGLIESVEYAKDDQDTPHAFRLRTRHGFVEWIGLTSIRSANFSMVDLAWLGKFFSPGRNVIVVGMRCGASGRELVARDIYDARLVSEALTPRGRR